MDSQEVLQDTVAPQAPIVVHHHQVAADQVEAAGSHTAIEKSENSVLNKHVNLMRTNAYSIRFEFFVFNWI